MVACIYSKKPQDYPISYHVLCWNILSCPYPNVRCSHWQLGIVYMKHMMIVFFVIFQIFPISDTYHIPMTQTIRHITSTHNIKDTLLDIHTFIDSFKIIHLIKNHIQAHVSIASPPKQFLNFIHSPSCNMVPTKKKIRIKKYEPPRISKKSTQHTCQQTKGPPKTLSPYITRAHLHSINYSIYANTTTLRYQPCCIYTSTIINIQSLVKMEDHKIYRGTKQFQCAKKWVTMITSTLTSPTQKNHCAL